MERLSRNFLAFLKFLKSLGNIKFCSLEQLFYRKKSLGAPESSLTLLSFFFIRDILSETRSLVTSRN